MKLDTLPGDFTRPTADRVKESLFNILSQDIKESRFADIFSGTGSIGCEALSRGAERVVFVDESRECERIILKNLKKMGDGYDYKVICQSFKNALINIGEQDLIFLDPPYHKNLGVECLDIISKYGILEKNGTAVLEHDYDEDIPGAFGNLKRYDMRKYGRVMLSFYRRNGGGE